MIIVMQVSSSPVVVRIFRGGLHFIYPYCNRNVINKLECNHNPNPNSNPTQKPILDPKYSIDAKGNALTMLNINNRTGVSTA